MTVHQEPTHIRLWGRILKGQKILRQEIVDCDPQTIEPALEALCHAFDIQRPIWLNKHTREMEQFGRTTFLRDHFMESIPFTKLEIELLLPEETRKKTRDPRIEA